MRALQMDSGVWEGESVAPVFVTLLSNSGQPQPPLPPAAVPFLSLPSCPVQSRDKSPFPLLLPEPGSPCGQLLPTVWESFIFKRHPHAASLPRAAPRCQPSSYASVCAASAPDFRVAKDSPLDSRIPELLHFSGGRKGVRDATAEGPTILGRYLLGEAAGTAGSLAWVWIQGILRELALQRAQRCVWDHTRGKNLLECPPHPRPTVSAPVKPFFSGEV